MTDLKKRYTEALMNTFGPPKLVLTRGDLADALGIPNVHVNRVL